MFPLGTLSTPHTSTLVPRCLNSFENLAEFMSFAAAESFHHHSCSTAFVFMFSVLCWNGLFGKWLVCLFAETHKLPHPSQGWGFLWLCVCSCVFYKQLRSLLIAYPSVILLPMLELLSNLVLLSIVFRILFKSLNFVIQCFHGHFFWWQWYIKQLWICSFSNTLLNMQKRTSSVSLAQWLKEIVLTHACDFFKKLSPSCYSLVASPRPCFCAITTSFQENVKALDPSVKFYH